LLSGFPFAMPENRRIAAAAVLIGLSALGNMNCCSRPNAPSRRSFGTWPKATPGARLS